MAKAVGLASPFTPAGYNGLPGMPFPGPGNSFSTKDEVGDYLEAYAARFQLPVRTSVRVDRLSRNRSHFVVEAGERLFEAENVVVAMATHQVPRVPSFGRELDPGILQLHSGGYRTPPSCGTGRPRRWGRQLRGGDRRRGGEGAPDVACGEGGGRVPFRIERAPARFVFLPLMFRFIGHRVLTVRTPIGRKLRPSFFAWRPARPGQAGRHRRRRRRARPQSCGRAGRTPSSRTDASSRSRTSSGALFGPDFSWIDLPVFGDEEEPTELIHRRGIIAGERGLYFVGPLLSVRDVIRVPARRREGRGTMREGHRVPHPVRSGAPRSYAAPSR